MKRFLSLVLCLLIAACIFSGCNSEKGKNKETYSSEKEENKETYSNEKIYNTFLSGEIKAQDNRGNVISIEDIVSESACPAEYALYDISGDNSDELIVKNSRELNIFTCKNNAPVLWYTANCYTKPLNNRALLSERKGGGPEHTDYVYLILDANGKQLEKTEFSYYPAQNNENEIYLINGEQVKKNDYTKITSPFFSIGDDKIIWHFCEETQNSQGEDSWVVTEKTDDYSISQKGHEYTHLTVWDKNGNILEDSIMDIAQFGNLNYENGLLIFNLQYTGGCANSKRFYDLKRGRVSPIFGDIVAVGENLIAYYDTEKEGEDEKYKIVLKIQSIFEGNTYFKKIERDFSDIVFKNTRYVKGKFSKNDDVFEVTYPVCHDPNYENITATTEEIKLK